MRKSVVMVTFYVSKYCTPSAWIFAMPPKKQKKEQEKAPVDDSFQPVDISTREPRTVILMLSSPEPAVVVKALQALHHHMKKSEDKCREMLELGVVSPLVGLLSSHVKATRSYAALCLSVMTTSAEVRKQVCAADGLPALLALLKPDEEPVTVEYGAAILSHMAREYSTKTKLLSLSAHQFLLPLMTGDDPNTKRYCLETVCQLVELHQARRAVAEEEGMSSLLSLLSSEFPTLQQLLLQTLISCMQDRDCRTKFREANGLSSLVSFMANKDVSDLHLMTATVLSLCLHDAENMTALQTSGSLDQLLSLMSDSTANTDMKRCAASAVAKAAQDEVNRKILHEQSVEKTFIQLLTHSDEGVVKGGLEGLSVMCGLSSGRARVGQEGGVVGVVSCAGREEGGVRAAAAQCLAHISTDSPANCKLIQEAEGCPALATLLTDSEALSRSGAATTISNMAPNPLTREELIAAEVIPALVSCLEFAEVAVQRSAAEALAVMGTDSAARTQFLTSGGVVSSLPLLSSASTALLTSALCLLHSVAQSPEVAQEFCGKGALQLLTQLSKRSHAPSAVGPALQQLLNSDLSAKWWTQGHLETSDIITNMEFFDPGPALAAAQPFCSLSSLLSQPLLMNRPILTANLLTTEAPPTPAETTPTPAVEQVSPSHPPPRSRSRGKSRKGQEVESKVSTSSKEEQQPTQTDQSESSEGSGHGLLPADRGLQSHISHTISSLSSLPSLHDLALALASYVCNSMGGPVTTSGNMTFELPQSELQKGAGSNVIAIGNITMGTYRHRALLYKILADQVGVACSLSRGDYGRTWNEVTIVTDTPRCYVVDLMTSGGRLLEAGSPEALQYCRL